MNDLSQNKRLARRQRHSPATRSRWWLRRRFEWFRNLRWWQKVLLIATPVVLIAVVIPLLMFAYFALTMGDMENLMNRNNTGVVLRDKDGNTFYSTGTADHREAVPLDRIAKSTKDALIASEDKNFYEHGGVSVLGTLRAVYGYVLSGGGEFGGSTLTQQLAKVTVLSTDRGFLRQYQAMSVAVAIEQRYSKDEILQMYLNTVYFGENAFGVEQAAKNYFNKAPADLSLAESAMLVGLLPAPTTYSPLTGNAALAKKQQAKVLQRMVSNGVISEAERAAALAEELHYQAPPKITNEAPHYTEVVLKELYAKYGEDVVKRSGMQVTTTLDLGLQRQANQAVANHQAYIQRMGGSNASAVVIDPTSFEIRALVGSVDYNNTQWGMVNMATTARQPGSSFKPIYYAGALADGVITPATRIKDAPINIGGYAPQNATRRFYGDVTVRRSLAWSLNIPSVKVMQQYGIERSVKAASDLGIKLPATAAQNGLSLALGSAEVPLSHMTAAYATFANQGQRTDQTTLREVKDKFDKVLYRHTPTWTRGISPQGAFLISSLLSDQTARATMFGSQLSVDGKQIAVKTGTTNDNRDAWTIGYTNKIAIGVWVGNNDNTPMYRGSADMAAPIWRAIMRTATAGDSPEFNPPSGVVEKSICYSDGGVASYSGQGTYQEHFLVTKVPDPGSCSAPRREEPREDQDEESRRPTVITPVVPTPRRTTPSTEGDDSTTQTDGQSDSSNDNDNTNNSSGDTNNDTNTGGTSGGTSGGTTTP